MASRWGAKWSYLLFYGWGSCRLWEGVPLSPAFCEGGIFSVTTPLKKNITGGERASYPKEGQKEELRRVDGPE